MVAIAVLLTRHLNLLVHRMPITQELLSVTYFVCPIPGANRFATSLRQSKIAPAILLFTGMCVMVAIAVLLSRHLCILAHRMPVLQEQKPTTSFK